MAKQVINVGASANDGTGDPNRTAFQKINANFTELYDGVGAGDLQQVTDNGNTTTNDITAGGFLSLGNANIPAINFNDAEDLDTSLGFLGADPSITTPRNWVLPNASGTLALQTPQYKFLLSQSGGDDPQTATSGTLTQGVTYEIVAFETGDDFTLSGAPNNDVGTKWIANGVAPTWSNGSEIGWNGGAPYIVGEITQNTLGGNIWFERIDVGYYQVKSDGLFSNTVIDFGSTSALVVGDGAFILRANRDNNSMEFTTPNTLLAYLDGLIVENVTTIYKYN